MHSPSLRLIFLLASGMALVGCDSRKPAARFLALGDSYTSGESVGPDDRWPVQLAHALKDNGIDLGEPRIVAVTGWTTDDLSAGIDRAEPVGPFELVTLSIGVNNQFRGRDPEEYRRQFHQLLEHAIQFAGGQAGDVVVVSIPDWGVTPFARGQNASLIGQQIDHFNDINRAESQSAGVAYVDVTPESRTAATQPDLLAADGLHPSPQMYAQWVKLMVPVVAHALGK